MRKIAVGAGVVLVVGVLLYFQREQLAQPSAPPLEQIVAEARADYDPNVCSLSVGDAWLINGRARSSNSLNVSQVFGVHTGDNGLQTFGDVLNTYRMRAQAVSTTATGTAMYAQFEVFETESGGQAFSIPSSMFDPFMFEVSPRCQVLRYAHLDSADNWNSVYQHNVALSEISWVAAKEFGQRESVRAVNEIGTYEAYSAVTYQSGRFEAGNRITRILNSFSSPGQDDTKTTASGLGKRIIIEQNENGPLLNLVEQMVYETRSNTAVLSMTNNQNAVTVATVPTWMSDNLKLVMNNSTWVWHDLLSQELRDQLRTDIEIERNVEEQSNIDPAIAAMSRHDLSQKLGDILDSTERNALLNARNLMAQWLRADPANPSSLRDALLDQEYERNHEIGIAYLALSEADTEQTRQVLLELYQQENSLTKLRAGMVLSNSRNYPAEFTMALFEDARFDRDGSEFSTTSRSLLGRFVAANRDHNVRDATQAMQIIHDGLDKAEGENRLDAIVAAGNSYHEAFLPELSDFAQSDDTMERYHSYAALRAMPVTLTENLVVDRIQNEMNERARNKLYSSAAQQIRESDNPPPNNLLKVSLGALAAEQSTTSKLHLIDIVAAGQKSQQADLASSSKEVLTALAKQEIARKKPNKKLLNKLGRTIDLKAVLQP